MQPPSMNCAWQGNAEGRLPAAQTHQLPASMRPTELLRPAPGPSLFCRQLVKVSWQAAPSDPRVLVSTTLAPAPAPPPVIAAMLALLVDNVTALQGVSESLLAQVKEYEKQVPTAVGSAWRRRSQARRVQAHWAARSGAIEVD